MTTPSPDQPRDPDWDDVPADLTALDGQVVTIDGEQSVLAVEPGLFGHARRLREGFYTEEEQ